MKFLKITNETYQTESALMDIGLKTPIVIVKGDYYHDKIDDVIDGFKLALNYMKIEYDWKEEYIGTENEWFKELEFYDVTEED